MPMKIHDESRFSEADVPPVIVRGALNLIQKRGLSPERLCRGLGFEPHDLRQGHIRVSYRQTSQLVRRAQQALNEPALGLAVGASQSLISWGLAGLGMLTFRSLGEAVAFGVEYQFEAGAMLLHKTYFEDDAFVVHATPRFFDPELEPYLVEDAFSSIVTIVRSLVGAAFKPLAVELAYPKPGHAAAYKALFNCPVHFDTPANRMLTDPAWLEHELPGYDYYTGEAVRTRLLTLMTRRDERKDLLESASSYLRAHVDEPQAIQGLARYLNLGERTLRRRLAEMDVSYRALLDRARYERSVELLQRSTLSIGEIAMATGFGDASNFRRAFKRWTGALPSELREHSGTAHHSGER